MKPNIFSALLLMAFASGCSSDVTGGPGGTGETSAATITVRGDFVASYEGQAVFGAVTDPDTGASSWVLELGTPGSRTGGATLWFVHRHGRPAAGDLTVIDLQVDSLDSRSVAAWFTGSDDTVSATAVSTGGTLTVTASSDRQVEGSFTVQAEGTVLERGVATAAVITITGEFTALSGTPTFPDP